MQKLPERKKNKIYRVIDANLNRLKEALRVCEDITRFLIDDYRLWLKFKRLRHEVFLAVNRLALAGRLLEARDTLKDVGKKTIAAESKRKDYQQIFFANIQRAKESLRVLEEFSKIIKKNGAESFKKIRYQLYSLEKEATKKLQALLHS